MRVQLRYFVHTGAQKESVQRQFSGNIANRGCQQFGLYNSRAKDQ
jgi:hypothetical protein